MQNDKMTEGIVSHRLKTEQYADNFSDLHAPMDKHEALAESSRCYFCYDAPCMTACPTSIDIPMFIRQIMTGNPKGSAKTIFDQNIMGGMCARVCPTETLCEEVCVREVAEGKPVKIGELQRYATDYHMKNHDHPYERVADSGNHIAIVGAGPSGLAAAHRLSMGGHQVTIFEAKEKAGGLNEYGIASYKSVNNYAQDEVNWLLQIGGIEIKHGQRLGDQISISDLQKDFDAVYLSFGLTGNNALSIEGEGLDNVSNATDFIATLRQADDVANLEIGRKVVVIGGGMTAVDAAVQAKLLGADEVTMLYRRSKENMSASLYEQELATAKGVHLIYDASPVSINGDGKVSSVTFAHTKTENGEFSVLDETFNLEADQVFKAIGQSLILPDGTDIESEWRKIKVDEHGQTSLNKVWAGGDCTQAGEDLTVEAVAQGRDAAMNIDAVLKSQKDNLAAGIWPIAVEGE